jgi:hypothetical protein
VTAIDDPEETVFSVDPSEDSLAERADNFFSDGALVEPEPMLPDSGPEAGSPMLVERLQERRLRARKVRRLVRHVEPWSVLKVALLFNFCMWVVTMVAGVLLWNAAETAGTISDVEQFAREIFALEEFTFEGEAIFNAVALGGLVVAVAATGFAVLIAILLNLISDLTGGVRVTVVEEETARPISTLPRRG